MITEVRSVGWRTTVLSLTRARATSHRSGVSRARGYSGTDAGPLRTGVPAGSYGALRRSVRSLSFPQARGRSRCSPSQCLWDQRRQIVPPSTCGTPRRISNSRLAARHLLSRRLGGRSPEAEPSASSTLVARVGEAAACHVPKRFTKGPPRQPCSRSGRPDPGGQLVLKRSIPWALGGKTICQCGLG